MSYKMPLNLNLKKGALHKTLHVPQGKKIPQSALADALASPNALTRKRANFAKVAATWNHGKQ